MWGKKRSSHQRLGEEGACSGGSTLSSAAHPRPAYLSLGLIVVRSNVTGGINHCHVYQQGIPWYHPLPPHHLILLKHGLQCRDRLSRRWRWRRGVVRMMRMMMDVVQFKHPRGFERFHPCKQGWEGSLNMALAHGCKKTQSERCAGGQITYMDSHTRIQKECTKGVGYNMACRWDHISLSVNLQYIEYLHN
jgi:hypothetical protein